MSQQPTLERRIPRTRTAHPYHPEQRVPQGWQGTAVRVRSFGSVASRALKKVRRPWNVERQEMMGTLVCSVGNATTDGKQVSISAYLLRV
jgi:hypothetical protein